MRRSGRRAMPYDARDMQRHDGGENAITCGGSIHEERVLATHGKDLCVLRQGSSNG